MAPTNIEKHTTGSLAQARPMSDAGLLILARQCWKQPTNSRLERVHRDVLVDNVSNVVIPNETHNYSQCHYEINNQLNYCVFDVSSVCQQYWESPPYKRLLGMAQWNGCCR
jgi:hypothetical protein